MTRLIHHLINVMEKRGSFFSDKGDVVSGIVYQVLVADDRKILRNYGGRSRLTTYLWPIIRNKIVDAVRRDKRYANRFIAVTSPESFQWDDPHETGEAERLIEEHIESEPPQERFIKLSKWMLDLSYEEIIEKSATEFPERKPLNPQRIAYVLHTNRKMLQKKFKINRIHIDK